MKNNKGIAPILIVLIIVGVLVLGGGTYYFLTKKTQKPVGCALEAKICPDGTAVGRTDPNCEFAPCPTTKPDETANWETYWNDKYGFEFKYPDSFEMTINNNQYALFDSTLSYQFEKEPDRHVIILLSLNDKLTDISLYDYLMKLLHWDDPIYGINDLSEGGFRFFNTEKGLEAWGVGPRGAVCGWEGEIYLMDPKKTGVIIRAYFSLGSNTDCYIAPKEDAQYYYDLLKGLTETFHFED